MKVQVVEFCNIWLTIAESRFCRTLQDMELQHVTSIVRCCGNADANQEQTFLKLDIS